MADVRVPRVQSTRALWITGAGLAAITNLSAPTVAQLTPGTGIKLVSDDLTKDYDVGMDDSDTVDDMGINDPAKVQAETYRNYHGMGQWFRRFDASTLIPGTTDCTALIGEGELGIWAQRDALPKGTAAVAAQKWDLFEFRSTVWKFDRKDGYYVASMKFLSTGRYATMATVAA